MEESHEAVLDALGDRTRRAILERLRAGPKPVVEIARGPRERQRRAGHGRPLLAGVLELLRSPALGDDPRYLIHLALAAGFLGDPRGIVATAERRLAEARERGALGVLVSGLALMAFCRAWLGDHAGAFSDAVAIYRTARRLPADA